ncbi:hypothetical protein EYF80_007016 [Liparis tanakae]|uniref:Uncharacterized protein n=1 Tax=Liparis tanakae TaxID=230148 RepID=A0A4Z2IXR5_9TELE|nr:hypothetical protein EYF80_007016 [Liparis tanakae]
MFVKGWSFPMLLLRIQSLNSLRIVHLFSVNRSRHPLHTAEQQTDTGPRQGHEEVTEVIGMPDEPPPARHQQTFPRCCGDGLQPCKGRERTYLQEVQVTPEINTRFTLFYTQRVLGHIMRRERRVHVTDLQHLDVSGLV